MKLCKDCRHIIRHSDGSSPECAVALYDDPVTGDIKWWFCWSARTPGGPCGKDAKLFEAAETRNAA